MLKPVKSLFILGLCAISLAACSLKSSQNNQNQAAVTQNEAAPAVSLMDQDGNAVSLNDYLGKKVYINIWASWCGPCKHEFPELEALYQEYKESDEVAFLSITSPNDSQFGNTNPADESKETILKVAQEGNITYPILFDTKDSMMQNFSIRAFPTHIILNSDGTINTVTLGGTTKDQLRQLLEKAK